MIQRIIQKSLTTTPAKAPNINPNIKKNRNAKIILLNSKPNATVIKMMQIRIRHVIINRSIPIDAN